MNLVKKIIIIAISIYLMFMFLVYAGIFRDNTDPLDVTKYYLECLKNKEGFLTYPISAPGCFDEDRRRKLYKKYKMGNIAKIDLKLLETKGDYAYVQAKMIYKDKQTTVAVVELEREGRAWLIRNIR